MISIYYNGTVGKPVTSIQFLYRRLKNKQKRQLSLILYKEERDNIIKTQKNVQSILKIFLGFYNIATLFFVQNHA